MAMQVREIPIRYRNRSQEQKDAEKKVVTGAGVTGAAVQMGRSKNAFAMFKSTQKLTQLSSSATNTARTVNMVAKRTTGLWAKVGENFKWAKGAVLKWGNQFKNLKYIKPIIESAAFKGVAGLAGIAFGIVTLISGVSEIAETATDVIDEHQLNRAA